MIIFVEIILHAEPQRGACCAAFAVRGLVIDFCTKIEMRRNLAGECPPCLTIIL